VGASNPKDAAVCFYPLFSLVLDGAFRLVALLALCCGLWKVCGANGLRAGVSRIIRCCIKARCGQPGTFTLGAALLFTRRQSLIR
jgi:hypothetical protein